MEAPKSSEPREGTVCNHTGEMQFVPWTVLSGQQGLDFKVQLVQLFSPLSPL